MNNTKKVMTNQQVPQKRNDEKACSVENNKKQNQNEKRNVEETE